jgi:Putative HNHc nuclease
MSAVPKPPKRRKPRKRPVKAKRATPRRAKNRCPGFLVYLRRRRMCRVGLGRVWGCYGPVEAAHVHARRNGGDVSNAVPLCRYHHAEQHRIGVKSFAAKYGLDLEALARRYWEDYLAELVRNPLARPAF